MLDIEYSIIRRPRRKTLSIVIRANNQVDVLAPKHITTALIESFVHDKQRWIHKKLAFNNHLRSKHRPKQFIAGEAFELLGVTYPLNIVQGQDTTITLAEGQLVAPSYAPDKLKKLLTLWYQQQANAYFQQRSQYFYSAVQKTPTCIAIKAYKSRWGSCHHDGRIYFNWRLIMAPKWVIDYVIVHELCHLIHHNHSKAFWQEVSRILPDYQQAKIWLKNNALRLEL